MIQKISLVLALLACFALLAADPTPRILDLQAQAATLVDTFTVLKAQAVAAATADDMVAFIGTLQQPMSAMVRLDVQVDFLSHQPGNPDDRDHWGELLTNMRSIGVALMDIEAELARFEDDERVAAAYAALEEKLAEVYTNATME